LSSMLAFDSRSRPSATDALNHCYFMEAPIISRFI
jgi:hypothetical protein